MAKTTYIDLTPEIESAYYKALQPSDRFIVPSIQKKCGIISRKKKLKLTQRSLLPQISTLWAGLTQGERDAWIASADTVNMKGWQLFVQDTSYRIKYGIEGLATPSTLHQYKVGVLQIVAPATELKIYQPHPAYYYTLQKTTGKTGLYQPAQINEPLTLPLTIGLNYKSDLVSQGAGSFAKFYALVKREYQGQTHDEIVNIDLDLSASWKSAEETLDEVVGIVTTYGLYIHLYNVRGTLLIDHVRAEHAGQNWARDYRCTDINKTFTRAFYQIPQAWGAIEIPTGADYESDYPQD